MEKKSLRQPFRSRFFRLATFISVTYSLVSPALAQQGPAAPARILVGFSPGGTLDVVARALAEYLHEPLNRTVVVENKPGAGGRIAVEALRAAPADGSVAMLCPDFLTSIYPSVFRKLNYVPEKHIRPVSTVAEFPMALAVPASTPVKTFAEYAVWVRAHSDKANFGHAASGGPTHFLGLQIGKKIGAPLEDVPFQGAAPMINNLIGGNVAAGTSTAGDFAQYHNAGKLRVLAITSAQRSPLLPDVPTFAELGFKDLTAVGTLAICLPPRAPASTVAQWSTAIGKAVRDDRFASKIRTLGFVSAGSSPAEAISKFNVLRSFWEPIIKSSGFNAD
ncbi:Bug family tripartite tricarboxylate transporter substrate binding protein [Cupriavidus basilensis]|uniref:Bug family tripartite tricarboxylate transporter substrate binding protein n=1 Tax=Cupriavidus basilensis TaxID=68895 RepID=UPI0039F69CCC